MYSYLLTFLISLIDPMIFLFLRLKNMSGRCVISSVHTLQRIIRNNVIWKCSDLPFLYYCSNNLIFMNYSLFSLQTLLFLKILLYLKCTKTYTYSMRLSLYITACKVNKSMHFLVSTECGLLTCTLFVSVQVVPSSQLRKKDW